MNENTVEITVLSRAEALKKIASIKGRAGTLRSDIDQVCRSAFLHAAEHGDLTLASRLYGAVSRSYHADIKRYFTTFGPVRFDGKSGQFVKAKHGGQWDLSALDVPFDSVKPADKDTPEYDRTKALTAIIKFLDTKGDQALNAGDAGMVDVLSDVAGLLARLVDNVDTEQAA